MAQKKAKSATKKIKKKTVKDLTPMKSTKGGLGGSSKVVKTQF